MPRIKPDRTPYEPESDRLHGPGMETIDGREANNEQPSDDAAYLAETDLRRRLRQHIKASWRKVDR